MVGGRATTSSTIPLYVLPHHSTAKPPGICQPGGRGRGGASAPLLTRSRSVTDKAAAAAARLDTVVTACSHEESIPLPLYCGDQMRAGFIKGMQSAFGFGTDAATKLKVPPLPPP